MRSSYRRQPRVQKKKSVLEDEKFFSDEDSYDEPSWNKDHKKRQLPGHLFQVPNSLKGRRVAKNPPPTSRTDKLRPPSSPVHDDDSSEDDPVSADYSRGNHEKGNYAEDFRTELDLSQKYSSMDINIRRGAGDLSLSRKKDKIEDVEEPKSETTETEAKSSEEDEDLSHAVNVLTRDSAFSGLSNVFKESIRSRNKNDIDSHLKDVVSLHLQRKKLDRIAPDAFTSFKSLAHLYLYDNQITKMVGISCLPQLETLHLSGNRINRIEDLDYSFNLRQLYLDHNCIEVIEGLENLHMLVELHIQEQKLPSEQPLIFCPNSLDTISRKLKVLNTGGNQLDSIEDLMCMDVLDTLNLSRNWLADLDHASEVLSTLTQLRVLDLRQNRISKNPRYKEKIIGRCNGLEILDGKDVNDTQRQALQRLCSVKAARKERQMLAQVPRRAIPVHQIQSFPGAIVMGRQDHGHGRGPRTHSLPVMTPFFSPDPNEPFTFSTPIRSSPTPRNPYNLDSSSSVVGTENRRTDTAVRKEVEQLYASRTMNNLEEKESEAEIEQMSEMAKIIFRLSSLTPEVEEIKSSRRNQPGAKDAWDGYTFGDRSATFKESRPLSPLEIDVSNSGDYTTGLPKTNVLLGGRRRSPIRRPMPKKLPARQPAGIGGRTLSPLQELPTPDSTTGRDKAGEEFDNLLQVRGQSSPSIPPWPHILRNKGNLMQPPFPFPLN